MLQYFTPTRAGIQDQWQYETLFKEVLEQVKRSAHTVGNAQMMRRSYNAKLGNWESIKEECRKEGKPCGWDFERLGGVTLSYVCPHCSCFPVDDYIYRDGNNRKKKYCNCWCAAYRGQKVWRAPNRILVVQIGANADRAAPLVLCDNLVNALKLLANQQPDSQHHCRAARKKQKGHRERTKKIHRSRQSQGCGCG